MRLNNKIIEVRQLQKSYKDVKAVNGIDFYVEEGELFAFLGLNGAGKSTTIDMLCTFLKLDRGSIKINNYEVGKDDEKIKSFHNRIRLDIYRFSRQIAHKTHKITNWTTANRLQK